MPASVTATVSGMSPASTSTRCSSPSSVRARGSLRARMPRGCSASVSADTTAGSGARVGDVRAIDPRMAAPQTLFAAARDADGGDHWRVKPSEFSVQGSAFRVLVRVLVLTYPTHLTYPAHPACPVHSGAT